MSGIPIPVVCTPLLGGRQYGAISSILEIGKTRILLDCGRLYSTDNDLILRAIEEIISAPLDAILLSHADLAHLGGLPSIFGANGIRNVPVICTLPVLKMGQMVLYDYFCNISNEGIESDRLPYVLDDVDACFSNVRTVKYNQTINITSTDSNGMFTSICALPAGRTIGGCMWHIKHGTAEVLYAMDINLKKELVLDGGTMELPQSPSLLIIEGGGSNPSRVQAATGGNTGGTRRKRTIGAGGIEREESLINSVMDTVRMEGNVLIPCETAGRTLEILQILGKYWADNKFTGMYHLCFLSPMGKNVLEFAKSQLEWMSDSISRGFYTGKPNPFALSNLNICSSIKEILLLGNGPKVVLVTDASLSMGMSKELLLRWGGDPRCRVIFVDQPDPGTLAAEIRLIASNPPIIATVTRPERVLLEGTELSDYLAIQQEDVRRQGEAEHRRMKERELAQLVAGDENDGDDTDHSDDSEVDEQTTFIAATTTATSSSINSNTPLTPLKRNISIDSMISEGSGIKRMRSFSDGDDGQGGLGRIAKYARPRYTMFETRLFDPVGDEYGLSNSDLKFSHVVTSTTLVPRQGKTSVGTTTTGDKSRPLNRNKGDDMTNLDQGITFSSAPSKIIAKKMRIQFTCGFKEMPPTLWGRIDLKGLKTIIGKVCPSRVIVLRGNPEDCDTVANQTKKSNLGIESFAPSNFQPIGFSVRADRIRVLLPHVYLEPERRHLIRGPSTNQTLDTSICSISLANGYLRRISLSMSSLSQSLSARVAEARADGVQLLQLIDKPTIIQPSSSTTSSTTENSNGLIESEEGKSSLISSIPPELVECTSLLTKPIPQLTNNQIQSIDDGKICKIGAVSVGEVLLKTLQFELEKLGVSVEYKLIPGGAILLCAGQVIVRKENENDFVVEGPPCQAYFQIKNAIYRQFAFI